MRTVNMKQADDKYGEVEEKESVGMMQQIVSKYLPYWPLLIVFGFLCMAGAYAYLRYATPIYESTATVMINDAAHGSNENAIINQISANQAQKDLDNEVE